MKQNFEHVKSVFPRKRNHRIDGLHALCLLLYLLLVFLDWEDTWKATEISIHTPLVYSIIFSFLFIRF